MNTQLLAKIDSSVSALEYELLTTHVDDLVEMGYTTYGMRVWDGHGNVLLEYSDISTSAEHVQKFIDMLKDRDVAAIHIRDLLEDYLD